MRQPPKTQPIETAPRDGSYVHLLYGATQQPEIARWTEQGWQSKDGRLLHEVDVWTHRYIQRTCVTCDQPGSA